MATVREIRRRIKSVKNIAQVTRAMQAVSASKTRRAQDAVLATRPYAQRAWTLLTHLAAQRRETEETHPLLQVRPVDKVAMVLLTSERRLLEGTLKDRRELELERIYPIFVLGRKAFIFKTRLTQ